MSVCRLTGKSLSPESNNTVLAGNGCSEIELVDEYVGMTAQKLCKGKQMSRDLTPCSLWF